MNYFLAKTDPEEYSIEDLESERTTVWSGVRNAQALQALRAMKPGDRVFIYHSGGQSRVAGLAKVSAAPRPDPSDVKSAIADFQFLARLDDGPTLREIKESGLFNDWALVRQSRLSTMAAPAAFAGWMRKRSPKAKI